MDNSAKTNNTPTRNQFLSHEHGGMWVASSRLVCQRLHFLLQVFHGDLALIRWQQADLCTRIEGSGTNELGTALLLGENFEVDV